MIALTSPPNSAMKKAAKSRSPELQTHPRILLLRSTTSTFRASQRRIPPYLHAVVANGFVFVSGQIPVKPGGGPTEVVGDTMQEQTRQALRNVQTILEAAGSSLDRMVKVYCAARAARPLQGDKRGLRGVLPRSEASAVDGRFGADIPGVLVAIEAIALA
jgi:2-iminobutanoate/2-iminopropanoate deaminase